MSDEDPHSITDPKGRAPLLRKDGQPDGRRNNETPTASRIKPGEVRNPGGRRGKRKKAAEVAPLTSIDEYYLSEGRRTVSTGPDGPVDVFRRLVQEEIHDALVNRDQNVRSRLLSDARAAIAKQDALLAEAKELARNYKANAGDEFRRKKAMRHLPPDIIPHPDHIKIEMRNVWISGPTDHEGRAAWETLKASIKVAAFFHDRYRKAARVDPSDFVIGQLETWASWRRFVMRRVPKGWDWREALWCRDSMQETVDHVINFFSKMSIEDEQRQIED